jgi:hypothetical protein
MKGGHIEAQLLGGVITLYAQIGVGGMVFRPGMGFHGPPFNLDPGVLPDIFEQVFISPFTEGTFIIVKNPHLSHTQTPLYFSLGYSIP